MPTEPTHDSAIDSVTRSLLDAVEDLRHQLRAHVPAPVIQTRAMTIRDLAEELYVAIEKFPQPQDLIIRSDPEPGR